MSYLTWALLALVSYSLVAPLMSVATTGTPRIPSDVAALMANLVLVTGTVALIVATDQQVLGNFTHPKATYVYAAGAFLTVGIISYYRALALGPVSVVTPIFGLFLVVSTAIGIVFLDESLTAQKAAGILCAILAVYLVTSN